MKYYAPQHKQLTLDLVRSSLDDLDKSNRWVQMGDNLPKQQRILEERRKQAEQDARDKGEEPPKPEAGDPNAAEFTDSQNRKHKGVLKIDATCADAEVRYPVDSTLLETACRKTMTSNNEYGHR